MSKKKTERPKPADVKYDNASEYVTFVVHTAKYRTLPTKKYLSRKKWVNQEPGNILATIPGTIYKIYVKKEGKVKKGQLLLELDAMKMYNKLLSPIDGVVKDILVEEKQKVPKNQLLLVIE